MVFLKNQTPKQYIKLLHLLHLNQLEHSSAFNSAVSSEYFAFGA